METPDDNALLDIIFMFFSALDELEPEEKSNMIHGVIHECDRVLRLADSEDDNPTYKEAISQPAFYNIYGQALHQYWFDTFEKYLLFMESSLLQCAIIDDTAELKDKVLSLLEAKIALERQMALTLKLARQKFKKALTLPEPQIDESDEDLELLGICSKYQNIKAEYTRTSLLVLVFLSKASFTSSASFSAHCTELLALVSTKFEKYTKTSFLNPYKDEIDQEIKEMLCEEVSFILEWLQDLYALSCKWNALLAKAGIDSESVFEILKKEECSFDGQLEVIDETADTEDKDTVEPAADIDNSLAYYTRCRELIKSIQQ